MSNIFFLNNSGDTWGGVENWIYKTAISLNERGHNSFIGARKKSPLYKKSVNNGLFVKEIDYISSTSFINPFRILDLKKYFIKNKIDSIFFCSSPTFKLGVMISFFLDIDNIIYRRGSANPIKNRFYNRYFLNYGITDFIANSKSTAKESLKLINKFDKDKIKYIYNGVNIKDFEKPLIKTNIREEFNIRSKDKIFVNVGRLSEQKGQTYLINSLKLVYEKFKDFKCLIVGNGNLEDKLKQEVSKLNLEDKIIFTGFRNDIASILSQSDLMIHTALWEGCPWSVLEGFAAGLPVVAADSTSLPELIDNGYNGYLAKDKDYHDISKKVLKIIKNDEFQKLGRNALKKAKENYSFERVVNQVEEIIN